MQKQKRQEHLFQLIKSLSKSEKRSFKIYAQRQERTHHHSVELFDLIEKQDVYDEQAIINKSSNKKLSSYISTLKVHLYKMIMKSLRQAGEVSRGTQEIRQQMDYIEILFEKGLYSQCQKMLRKAQKIAREYESHVNLDQLSIYEFQIAMKLGKAEDLQRYLNETFPEANEMRKINLLQAEFERITAAVKLVVVKSARIGTGPYLQELEEIMTSPLLHKDPDTLPDNCKADYHAVWGYYHHIMGNAEECIMHRRTVLTILEKNEVQVKAWPKGWLDAARALMISLGQYRWDEDFDAEEVKVKAFVATLSKEAKSKNLNAEIYNTIYNTKLDNLIDRGYFKEAATYADEAAEHFESYRNQIEVSAIAVLYCNFACAYFGNGEYRKALKWTNNLIDGKFGSIRLDLQCAARIISIATHYELEHYDIIGSLVRSADRYFTKVERKYEVEKVFLKFARKQLMEPYHPRMEEAFTECLAQLQALESIPLEKRTLGFFGLIGWLQSRMEGRTMEAVVTEMDRSRS